MESEETKLDTIFQRDAEFCYPLEVRYREKRYAQAEFSGAQAKSEQSRGIEEIIDRPSFEEGDETGDNYAGQIVEGTAIETIGQAIAFTEASEACHN